VELPGTDGAYAPFFSPDGQWVAFFAEGKLKKVSVQGGPAIALCRAPIGAGGSWGEDGNIILGARYIHSPPNSLVRLAANLDHGTGDRRSCSSLASDSPGR